MDVEEDKENDFKFGTIQFNCSNVSLLDNSFDMISGVTSVAEKRTPFMDISIDNNNDNFCNQNKFIIDETSQDSGYGSCDSYQSNFYSNGPYAKIFKHSDSNFKLANPTKSFKQNSTTFQLPSTLSNGLRFIDSATLVKLQSNQLVNPVSKFIIFDCRYPYEYEGGHIEGAMNSFQFYEVLDLLFECDEMTGAVKQPKFSSKCVLIFHCEFSVNRAPTMARALRRVDRKFNELNYPNVCYPDVYILKGGYKEYFHAGNGSFCEPSSYRKMLDINYVDEMKKYRGVCRSKSENYKEKAKSNGENSTNYFGRSRSLKF